MTRLYLDFESRSELSLPERGLANYLQHKSTRALMLAWALDDQPVKLWQAHLDGEFCSELRGALADPSVIKTAYNAPFEHGVFKYVFRTDIPYSQFADVLVWARHLSVTGTLEEVGEIFGLPQDQAKIKDGARLIKKFCEPAVLGGEETLFGIREAWFPDWDSDPDDWQRFCDYCKQDVVAERALLHKIEKFPLPDLEQRAWEIDQVINSRGLPCDLSLVNGSLGIAADIKTDLREQIKKLTGVENPNSNEQILKWIRTQGYTFSGMAKPFVNRALAGECDLTEEAREVLEIRKQAAKTSDSKLDRIAEVISGDSRLRHQFAFMGAARTGRWSSLGGVQVQNLPRPAKAVAEKLDLAINLLRDQDGLGISLEFPSPMEVVTSTLRSIFRASSGKKLLVCDLGAVENRVLGWLASCDSITEVFRKGLCPYKSFAVDLFGVPYDQVTKQQRQDSKPGILGGGYQLSGGEETINEDGDKIFTGLMGYGRLLGVEISKKLAHDSIRAYREKHREVVNFWYAIEDAAIKAIRYKRPQTIGPFVLEYFPNDKILRLLLPSGRGLHYLDPQITHDDRFDKDGVTYLGKDQKTKQWVRLKIYGGKWVENGDQAISRDLLVNGMFLAEKKGLNVIGHTHDELIAEVDVDSKFGLDDLRECMIQAPAWGSDLILDAAGYETSGPYRKD